MRDGGQAAGPRIWRRMARGDESLARRDIEVYATSDVAINYFAPTHISCSAAHIIEIAANS